MKILSFKKNTKFPSSLHFPVSTCNSNINPSFWKCNINDGICSEDDSTLSPFFLQQTHFFYDTRWGEGNVKFWNIFCKFPQLSCWLTISGGREGGEPGQSSHRRPGPPGWWREDLSSQYCLATGCLTSSPSHLSSPHLLPTSRARELLGNHYWPSLNRGHSIQNK